MDRRNRRGARQKKNQKQIALRRLLLPIVGVGMLINLTMNVHQENVIDHNTSEIDVVQKETIENTNSLYKFGNFILEEKDSDNEIGAKHGHGNDLPPGYCMCRSKGKKTVYCETATECDESARKICEVSLPSYECTVKTY